ncbi:hypothetical protein PG994_003528 [Apiospora phragmitis]|uniref:F-box domain-containing protein n=1 Tax=Apiospora phragmitis TaxID=2905665 RepID=A0ABR1VYB1_9PEZI
MAKLPNEIYRQILSPLDLGTLQACRLASRPINQPATELLFRHISLSVEFAPAHMATSSLNFIQIATASHLRPLVREIAIKTVPSVAFTHKGLQGAAHNIPQHVVPEPFLHALPFLRAFTGLKSLEVSFDGATAGRTGLITGVWIPVHLSGPFAGLVVDTCLRCLIGEWSCSRQVRLQNELLRAIQAIDCELSAEWPPLVTAPHTDPMEVTTLTIKGQPLSMQTELPEMLLSCKSLMNLQLQLVSPGWETWHNLPRQLGDRFDIFQNLPKTWLLPAIAQNLRVLSLVYEHYWGWTPKMDFRTVNPGIGLPNLRVLSLGCYVFSHEWQADWIASLGRQNGHGGLEELYLKDCPIMWEARVHSSLDESITELPTTNGDVVRISNEGYPDDRSLLLPDDLSSTIEVSFPLRWSHVLDPWASTMPSTLKRFVMGSDPWGEGLYEQWQQLPANSPGLLQYVHFNIGLDPEPWIEQDDRRRLIMDINGLDKYNTARKSDYDSYDNFVDAIKRRLQSSNGSDEEKAGNVISEGISEGCGTS